MIIHKAILPLILSTFYLSACEDIIPDKETLYYNTKHNIAMTLDIELELYRANSDKNLFYINSRYYKKNKHNQWMYSNQPNVDSAWTVYPDQFTAPETLRNLK